MRSVAWIAAVALAAVHAAALAQGKAQFVPAMFFGVDPYASGGSSVAGGMLDYLAMLNRRDGGVNGVRFTWERGARPETTTPAASNATNV